jgi:hypothetical protein
MIAFLYCIVLIALSFNIDVSRQEQKHLLIWSIFITFLYAGILLTSLLRMKFVHLLCVIAILAYLLQVSAMLFGLEYIFLPDKYNSLDFVLVTIFFFVVPILRIKT